MKSSLLVTAVCGLAVVALASFVVRAQPPDREGKEPQDQPARPAQGNARDADSRGSDDRDNDQPRQRHETGGRQESRAARPAPARTGIVKEFSKNPRGDTDGFRLDDGTEVRFPARSGEKLTGFVSLKDKVTIEGWTHPGETEIHAATVKHEASGKVITVDRPPPEVSGVSDRPGRDGPGDEAAAGPPPRRSEEDSPGPRADRAPGGRQPSRRGEGRECSLEQAVSDHAQLHTIAFDGLAFLTGSFGADTFLPPGKVSDYFGFQYMRDIDANEGGHNTSFLTRIAYNMLAILSDAQKAQLVALGEHQEGNIQRFAELRLPLIWAFRRNLEGDLPAGARGLDKKAVVKYSAGLYELDGLLAFERAKVMGGVLRSFNERQKAALARLKFGDSRTWPDVPEPIDRRSMSHTVHVAVMTYASEMFAWQGGSVEADTYFCPERHGMYFGGFGMKTAPAMGKRDYSISTSLTGDSGEAFLNALTGSQRKLITDLVDLQRKDLGEIVTTRRAISTELRRFLKGAFSDQDKVLSLSRRYGELDGGMSYLYATAFAKVGKTLTGQQRQNLARMRTSSPSDPRGPFLYSSPISAPNVGSTDFLFGVR